MIKIHSKGNEVVYDLVRFSGGELHPKIISPVHSIATISWTMPQAEELTLLCLLVDALKRIGVGSIRLYVPYLPYGRQDRACVEGEAFSLKVFANIINSLNFSAVETWDAHSDVTGALINNLLHTPQWACINNTNVRIRDLTFVSPDAGANKKMLENCQFFEKTGFIRADKVRDVNTGAITDTVVYCDDLQGASVLIVDDICDGGSTFIPLAKKLREKGAGEVGLYVTHGIFSKGLQVFEGVIDNIYCANPWVTRYSINQFNKVQWDDF